VKPTPGTLVVTPYNPMAQLKRRVGVALLWTGSLVGLYVFCKHTMTPGYVATQAQLRDAQTQIVGLGTTINQLKDDKARAERGLQVSEEAKNSLQRELDAKQDEINAMRADLNFYQKFAGGGNTDPISVQDVSLTAGGTPRVYTFRFALSQNLKRSKQIAGTATLSISGMLDGKAKTLGLAELSGESAGKQLTYDFKYFQLFSGTLYLPENFSPNAVIVRMRNTDGESAAKEVSWKKALENSLSPS
jgi:hypothetical protein